MKTRLDKLLVDRGLVPSRERAHALILAGKVLVDEQKISKAGASVSDGAALRLLAPDLKYVSRGGLKLEKALDHWRLHRLLAPARRQARARDRYRLRPTRLRASPEPARSLARKNQRPPLAASRLRSC